MAHGLAASIFFIRCTFSGSLATRNLLLDQSVFTVTFSATCWARVLTELCASGLLATSLASAAELFDALTNLAIHTPANLVIHDTDIVLAEAFNAPGTPAVPGRAAVVPSRGRRAAPAVPATPAVRASPGPVALRFFHLASPLVLSPPDTPSSYIAFAAVQRLLGPCLTRASRANDMSQAHMVAGVLRPHLERRVFGAVGIPDHLVAAQLKDFVLSLIVPIPFQSDHLDPNSIVPDLVSCLRYFYGTTEDRRVVETSWLPRLTG